MKNLFLPVSIIFLILFYTFSSKEQIRFDLTNDKRYSISSSSIEIIKKLENPVKFQIFLSGDLPSGMSYLKSSIDRIMIDIQYYNKENVTYEFIDIDDLENDEKSLIIEKLLSYGINPTDLVYNSDKGRVIKRIFPGILLNTGSKTEGILLLTGDKNYNSSEIINQSIENLEFEIISSLFFIVKEKNKRVAFISGHNELDSLQIESFKSLVEKKYHFERININNSFNRINEFELLIIAKPKSSFSLKEKFFIDQFLMKGGRILFLLDALGIDLNDSSGNENLAYQYDHNLDDLLYKYGVRINKDYIKDYNSALFPVVVGNFGNNPNIVSLPFPYFPEIFNYGNHSIVKNLGTVISKFVSSIDTVNNLKSINKIPLFWTSQFSSVDNFPVLVRLSDLSNDSKESDYTSGSKLIGILLEGNFTSFFANRIFDFEIDNQEFISNGTNSKIILISDGDIIRNDVVKNKAIELGNDYFQKKKYANKELLQNILFYLLEDEELIDTKMKDFNYYQLNKSKTDLYKVFYQSINLIIPISLFMILFILRYIYRKKKYNFKN